MVIVGKIGKDDEGWYILPEQPLNITYEYFLEKPSVFSAQTKIKMFDPAIDGIEKSLYIGQTVTAAGIEATYEIRLSGSCTDFVNKVSAAEGVEKAVLVSYNGDYMG